MTRPDKIPLMFPRYKCGKVLLHHTVCVVLLIAALFSAGCRGDLRFPNVISPSQERDLGQEASEEIDRQNKLIVSGPQYDQLQRVAGKIFPLAKEDLDVPYTIKLIDSKEVNAFALPGGPIYFYKGLMDIADSDDEVAAVLGHESTHVVRHHVAKRISDAQFKGMFGQVALGNASGIVQELAGFGLEVDSLHYSRDVESEADRNGFRYLVAAGYDPYAMSRMFRKLQADSGSDDGPSWLQDHPQTASRIAHAQTWADDYERARLLPED